MSEAMIANVSHTGPFAKLLEEVPGSSSVQWQTVPFGENSVRFLPFTPDFVPLLVLQITPMQNCTDNLVGKL